MHKKLELFTDIYLDLVNKKLFPLFDKLIKKELVEFENLETNILKLYASNSNSAKDLATIKKQILDYTEEIWNTNSPQSFSDFVGDFINELKPELDKLPVTARVAQKPERFIGQETDSTIIRLTKPIKRFSWVITQIPKRIVGKKPTYWKHRVPLRNLAREQTLNRLGSQLNPLLDAFYVQLMKAYIDLNEWESAQKTPGSKVTPLNRFESLKKEASKVKRALKVKVIGYATSNVQQLAEIAEKIGTIERGSFNFKSAKIEKNYQTIDSAWMERDKGWINTLDVVLEAWRSDLSLQTLMLQAQQDLQTFTSAQNKNISEYIGDELDAIKLFVDDSIKIVESADENLVSELKKRIYQTRKSLDQRVIPALLEKLGNKNLINGISRLESCVQQEMEQLNTDRRIPKIPTDYLQPIESDDITTISPYELIAFEIAPDLGEKFNGIKAELVGKLNENLLVAQDLDHMISYSLSSAMDEFAAHGDVQAAKNIALESLNRSHARVEDVRQSLEQCMEAANEKISFAVENYVDSLEDLTKTENVREIRLRVMRAKAIQSTEEYRDKIRNKVFGLYKETVDWVKKQLKLLLKLKDQISKRLSLGEEEDVDIDVANFLIDSEHIIESLPLIYRNLYRIAPITDQELYVGREAELDELKEAYKHWAGNKKGAIAIIGEKWSGLTSFVNHIEQEGLFNYRCNRFVAKSSNNNLDELLTFLSEVLDEKISSNTSWTEIADKLNQGTKKVIIIEDLQCLYFRKIGGFSNLTGISELIQQTSGHILWVVTCGYFSWMYFQDTIQIDESFRFIIELQQPSEKEIEQLIEKRNRISGYTLHFIASESDRNSKKFTRLSEAEQQRQLKDRFFKNLISFSSSNISMALMFWLLSTNEVTKDQIKIGEFRKPNFGFLNVISMEKVLSLHLLILHDGLTLKQFTDLARMPHHTCQSLLASMHEDGILLMKNHYYMVNPLIYRSVINLLTTKNLLQ